MCSAHSAENDWCLEARPPCCLSTSQLREARWYKADGRQMSAKLVSLDLSAQSRAGRMRISRRVQIFAPKDRRTSVAEIALRCEGVFVCNIRWHCWPMKLSMSSWLFYLIGLFLNYCVCYSQPFWLDDTNQVKKSLKADPDSQLAHWKACDTLSWTYLNKF